MSDLFEGFPKPQSGDMTLYVLGPGIGECQVLSLPDEKWLVVDCCCSGKSNLAKELLNHFGAKEIALLAITHSYVDHIQGIPDLLQSFKVRQVWQWAHAGTRDDVLPRLCSLLPNNRRLRLLCSLQQAISSHEDANPNSVVDATTTTIPWSPSGSYSVCPLSPTPHEVHHYRKAIDALFEVRDTDTIVLNRKVNAFLGSSSRMPLPGNGLSVALSIGWGSRRILLGGDVEVSADQDRGWGGMLKYLKEEGRVHLLHNISVVKVAHHGSPGAFLPEAWKLHSSGGRVKVAVVTPHEGLREPLPRAKTLQDLSHHAERLAVTRQVKGAGHPLRNGWKRSSPSCVVGASAAAVAVVIPDRGGLQLYLGKDARCFGSD